MATAGRESAFEGRVVFVSGASAGVGRAVARRFAERGALLGLFARDRERLEAAAKEVRSAGGRARVWVGDVSEPEQIERAAEDLESTFGPIDVWVNNAIVTVMSLVAESTPEDFRRVTEVSYLGTVYGTLAALRRMRSHDRGTIVQVGSALAYRPIPLQSAYCASKHAVRAFTDSLRTELRHERSGVHVTMVQLPALNTPQFGWSKIRLHRHPQPVPPIYQPEVAADAIVFAAGARRREVWVGGNTPFLILANKLAPALGDAYLARRGFASQLTEDPASPERPHNLYEPVAGDLGAHGRFDDQSKGRSRQLWATVHRRAIALGGLGAAAAAAVLWLALA